MIKAVIVLVCLVCVGWGRRMLSLWSSQNKIVEESREPGWRSLVELSQSMVSDSAAAWNPNWRPNHIVVPTISHQGTRVGNMPITPSTNIRKIHSPNISISKHNAQQSTVHLKPPEGNRIESIQAAMDSMVIHQAYREAIRNIPFKGSYLDANMSVASQVEEKQAWHGGMGTEALILLLAKLCFRIAFFFRIRSSSDPQVRSQQSTSIGVASRVPVMSMIASAEASAKRRFPVDISLIVCVAAWYVGNYYFNVMNKLALNATGGAAGFPLTIATLQLGIGAIYAIFLWLAPDARPRPRITFKDFKATLPVAAAASAAHFGVVFSSSAGSVSFAQIVFATEPVFAALIGTFLYGASISTAKLMSLIPIIGGVCLALYGEVHFALAAFVAALLTNACAALRVNEHKKLMSTEGITERLGSVGNQYAVTTINMFLMSIPVALLTEGRKLGAFISMCSINRELLYNLVISGLAFYLYSEVATVVIKKAGPVTQSVLNCAKRAIIIIAVALVLGEHLGPLKLIGSAVSIAGVLLYSRVDDLTVPKARDNIQE